MLEQLVESQQQDTVSTWWIARVGAYSNGQGGQQVQFAAPNTIVTGSITLHAVDGRDPSDPRADKTNASMYLSRMPAPYFDEKTVSVSLNGWTFRDAVCMIMKAYPIRLYYSFHPRNRVRPKNVLLICTNDKEPEYMLKPGKK